MVAVVSGSGYGLFNSSTSTLGGAGANGNAQVGRGRDRVYVNTSTGNLVVQSVDETLAAVGLDFATVRTYNSQGLTDDDNGDQWRFGVEQKIALTNGTHNQAGSVLTKTFGDGTTVRYTWNATRTRYESTDGDGANDFIKWNTPSASRYTWTDGSSRATEEYWLLGGAHRLKFSRDADGNTVTYNYNPAGTLLTSITMAAPSANAVDAQTITFTYGANNNVTAIGIASYNGSTVATQTLTRYRYDGSNRLIQVIVDLTPVDNTVPLPDVNGDNLIEATANQTYITTYTYEGTSKRVGSITQSDGSSVGFTYQSLDSGSRLKTVTDAEGRVTTFTYTEVVVGTAPNQTIYQRTRVDDGLTLPTTYLKDALGRLISVQTPAVSGSEIETRYTYDSATGNVATITQDPTGLNRVTTFAYAAATGLLLSSRDSLGNTVTRTYNSTNNQLETETSYLVRDPDGAGSGQPSTPLTSRYIYDGESHLRFAISADGRVTEHVYNVNGDRITTYKYAANTYTGTYTESALGTWASGASGQRGNALERVDYAYDFRRNVSTITAWASTNSSGAGTGAASVTRFIYDQRGLLLTTVEARGEATSTPTNDYVTNYIYDGLGRTLTTTTWVSSSETARPVQTISYDDANRSTVTTLANALINTATYNRGGDLISVANGIIGATTSLGTTRYTYDADGRLRVTTDATLLETYCFYDDAGRKIGYVDGDGSLVEHIYNRANQLIKTVRYSTRLGATTLTNLAGGSWSTVAFSALRTEANPPLAINPITRNVYDASGMLVFTVDELGAVTKNVYDGAGRLTDQIRYGTPQVIGASVDEVLPAGITVSSTDPNNRRTRFFYNGDGQLTGTLDGAGYLKENIYDAAGRLITQIGYFNASDPSRWDTGTLETLRPGAAQLDANRDIRTRFFYDAQGRKTGELDGGRYLTEIVYDVAGHVLQTVRYDDVNGNLLQTARSDARADTNGTATFSALKSAAIAAVAAGATMHSQSFTYDALGQVLTETNFETTETAYTYDIAGNIVAITRANGVSAEARTTRTRYDVMGRVTQELTAEGAVVLAALPGTATLEQINDVWNKYGVAYTYDDASRRTSMKMRPNDSQTNTTHFYYDDDGRLRFELDPLGRVTENRYDALGQLTERLVYWRTVSVSNPAGGLLTPALIATLSGTESADVHEKATFTYSKRGELLRTTTVAGATTDQTYNVFGEVATSAIGTQTPISYTYDARGLQRLTQRGSLTLEDRAFDAFGRLKSIVDRGNTTTVTYDRLGREITTSQSGDANARLMSYDGFSRVLTVRDKLLNTTSYAYNDSTRTVTVTTPESIVVSSVHNRHGETLSVTANGNTTNYIYDRNGQLTGSSDNFGALEGRAYDGAGRQISATDARDTITTFAYDAANRILTRTVDTAEDGLALATTYGYDSQSRVMTVTEPGNRVTRTEYDRDGRVSAIVADANGAKPFRTEYQYDTANNTTLVTEGVGAAAPTPIRRTQYFYDSAGRRTHEYVDPTLLGGALNLHTEYRYDNNDNLTRKIDARGNSTWYAYDAQHRLFQTIDALGGVTQLNYDSEDRVIFTRRYFNTVAAGGLGDAPAPQSITSTTQDRVTRSVYDRDGREKYTLQTLSATGSPTEQAVVTERTFDAGGKVTRTRMYFNAITVPATVDADSVAFAITLHADDRVARLVYDVRGRPEIQIDGGGAVTKYQYDANGNVTQTVQYAATVSVDGLGDDAAIRSLVVTLGNAAQDRVTRFWYDTLDRSRFTLDAEGFLSETRYFDADRIEETYRYFNPPTVAANSTTAQVADAITTNALDRYERSEFDTAGRLSRRIDALSQLEVFEYDAVGNKIRFTNKKDSVWNYVYDANHRLTEERSPSVAIITMTEPSPDGGTLTAAGTIAEIVTRIEYNALGDVTRRIEAFGRPEQRLTNYGYDELGRQTTVSTPDVRVYAPTDEMTSTPANMRQESTVTLTSTTRYDVFGNAVVGQDANGNYSHKAYDQLGRIVYDVDALRNVTLYKYDVFGNGTRLTRHFNAVSLTSPSTLVESATWSAADIESHLTTNAKDRVIITEYDRLNRAKRVLQPPEFNFDPTPGASPGGTPSSVGAETVNIYNAFGEVVLQRQLFKSPSVWADTYFYFDKLGRRTAAIDPLGYLTGDTYDAVGNVTRHYEAAKPSAAGSWNEFSYGTPPETTPTGQPDDSAGYDRDFRYVYDRLDRKTQARQLHVEVTSISGQATARSFVEQLTTYDYDAVGNQVRVTDHAGAATYTYYDVLGRVTAVAEPTRDIDGTGDPAAVTALTPFTYLFRNAHGDLVGEMQYANGAASVSLTSHTFVGASANDRYTRILVDNYGRIRRTQDGTGANRFLSYDRIGKVAKEWQPVVNVEGNTETLVNIHRYDKLGRETTLVEPQKVGTGAITIHTQTRYNAFGEIIEKGRNSSPQVDGVPLQEYYEYDNAGRLWKTNSKGGVDTVILYDLLGNATGEIRSLNVNLRTDARAATAAQAYALSYADAMRTETVYDKLGRVVEQRQPTFETSTGVAPIAATFTIGWVDGPANPAAIYQRVINDYGDGPVETFEVNPAATLAQDGGWYLDASSGYQQDPTHLIGSSVRISWNAPTEAGVNATFQYRLVGSTNENDFASAPVGLLAGDKLGVDVIGLNNQNYEYRVRYQRTAQVTYFAEAKGSFRVDGTSSASLGVTPAANDPANEVNPLPAVSTGGIVSWAAPSGSLAAIVATFRIAKPGVGWLNQVATLNGSTFSADLRDELATAGTYTYEVVYQRDGNTVALHTGTLVSNGVTNDRQVSVQSHDTSVATPVNEAIGTVTAQNSGLVGATIVSSQLWGGIPQGWTGTNRLQLNWADIGPGAVKVRLDYQGKPYEIPSQGEDLARPGVEIVNRELIPVGDARTGTLLTFGALGSNGGGIAILRKVQVLRETSPGVFTVVYVQTNPTTSYGRALNWAAPVTFPPSRVSSFEYAPQGTSNYSTLPIAVGSSYGVSLNGVTSGNYTYRIRYRVGGRILSEQTGNLTIAANGTVSNSLISNQTFPATVITASLSGDLLSWNHPTDGAPTSVVLTYSLHAASSGGGSVTLTPTSGSNYSYRFSDIVNTGLTSVFYSINYLHAGETDGYVVGGNHFFVQVSNQPVQPRIDIQTQTPLFPSGVQAIPAATGLESRYVTWSPLAQAGAAVEFRYKLPNTSTWTTLPASVVGGAYRVELLGVANGTLDYEITYTQSGQQNPYARGRGQFTVNRTSSVTGFNITPTLPTNPPLVQSTPRQLQSLDRWGNVIAAIDSANQTTIYRYTVLGGLAQITQPQVEIVATAGGNLVVTTPSAATAPKSYNYFDALGRVIGTKDANGIVNSVTLNLAGQAIRETHADGGIKKFVYDAFGNVVITHDELNWGSIYTYDRASRLVLTQREVTAGVWIDKQFVYDEAGRRIRESNGAFSTINDGDGGLESTRYTYDLAGNLLTRRTELGYTTTYGYDVQGRKTSELDAIGGTMSWTYDDFFLRTHTNLAGITYTHNYNKAGLQTTQTGGGQNITYSYDWAGHTTLINDTGVGRVTTFSYDAAGRRARERTVLNELVHQDTTIGYDAIGRISTLTDLRYDLKYRYDAHGNRTHISATYYDHQQTPKTQNLWYTYDAMNRVLVSQGVNTFGLITIDNTAGVRMTYDLAGHRKTSTQWGTQFIRREIRDVWQPDILDLIRTDEYRLKTRTYSDTYTYDGAGRLTAIDRGGELYELTVPANGPTTESTSPATFRISERTYDGASRMTNEFDWVVEQARFRKRTHTSVYDDDGRLTSQTNRREFDSSPTVSKIETTISYNVDQAGVLRSYSMNVWDTAVGHTNNVQYTSNYVNAFRLADSYLDAGQSVSSTGSGEPDPGSTTRNYNVNNELISFVDSEDHRKNRYFANDANGNALTVIQPITTEEGTLSNLNAAFQNALLRRDNSTRSQHFFFANGQSIGSFGQLIDEGGAFKANFDVNYQPISANNPTSAPPIVIAQTGDTSRTIAQRVFGDSSLWYLIAEENGFTSPDTAIQAGTQVRVPNQVISLSNDANTFKPFNPADAIGDTTPTQPFPPPPKKGCGVIGMIIMIVVMVVVTIFTAGALTAGVAGGFQAIMGAGMAAMGSLTVLGGAVVGAISSVITQGIGIALGIQDKFDWKGVATAAIGGGVSAALGGGVIDIDKATTPLTKALTIGANAAISNTVTQGVTMAVGLQKKFEWRSVAASAAGAMVGASVGRGLNGKFGDSLPAQIAEQTLTGFAGGAAGAVLRGGKIDYATIAADAFGNALGNAIVSVISKPVALRRAVDGLAAASDASEGSSFAKMQEIARDSSLSYNERASLIDELAGKTPSQEVAQYLGLPRGVRDGSNALLAHANATDQTLLPTGVVDELQADQSDARDAFVEALHSWSGHYATSEQASQDTWDQESLFSKALIVTGAGLDYAWDGIKSTAQVIWAMAKGAGKANLAIASAVVDLATSVIRGDFEGVEKRVNDHINSALEAVGTLDARMQSIAAGAKTFIAIASDPQIRSEIKSAAWGAVENTSTPSWFFAGAKVVTEILMNIGTAGGKAASTGARLAGTAAATLTGLGRRPGTLRYTDNISSAATALRILGIAAHDFRNTTEILGHVFEARRLGNVGDDQLRTAVDLSRRYATHAERSGVFYGIVRMQNRGWQFGGVAKFGSNNGLDAIFFKPGDVMEYAILEAKSAGDLSSLSKSGRFRQGTKAYNMDRLNKAIAASTSPEEKLSLRAVSNAYDAGRVKSYASFGNSGGRLVEIPSTWKAGRLSESLPWLPQRGTIY